MSRNRQVGISRMMKHNTLQKTVGIVVLARPRNRARNARRTKVCGLTMIPRHLPTLVNAGLIE